MAIDLDLARPVTDEDLRTLSERNPAYRFERTAEGRLVVSPTGGETGRRNAEVVGQVRDWNRRAGLGVVFDSSTGFALPDGSCRSPDAAWVGRDRWQSLTRAQRDGYPPLCPDAVFEVRSTSDGMADLQAKMRPYLSNGTRLAVLLDPGERVVEVWRPGRAPERHRGGGTLSLEPELLGFHLDLEACFAD